MTPPCHAASMKCSCRMSVSLEGLAHPTEKCLTWQDPSLLFSQVHMLARVMYAGIAAPDWRHGFIRATQVGCGMALLGLLIAFIASLVSPEGSGALAGAKVFEQGSMTILAVALLWAPCFETLVGQFLPVTVVRLFTKAELPAVVCSGLVFGLGHMAGGGGAVQGILTTVTGTIFAAVYVANIGLGRIRASLLTAWAHCVNNALVLALAMNFPSFG